VRPGEVIRQEDALVGAENTSCSFETGELTKYNKLPHHMIGKYQNLAMMEINIGRVGTSSPVV
jgi:hypothetical protein